MSSNQNRGGAASPYFGSFKPVCSSSAMGGGVDCLKFSAIHVIGYKTLKEEQMNKGLINADGPCGRFSNFET